VLCCVGWGEVSRKENQNLHEPIVSPFIYGLRHDTPNLYLGRTWSVLNTD